jgi:competence protein ComEC
MPSASWILLALILGSAAGSAGSPIVTVATVALCAGIAWRVRRAGALAVCATVMLCGAMFARAAASRWGEAHCRASIVRGLATEFVTDFDLQVGDAGPATLRARTGSCTTTGSVRARQQITGGQWYTTPARADPGPRGLTLLVADATPTGHSALRPRLRAAGVRRVDSVFTIDAPMARALLLADMHMIDPALRQRWARAGLVHLLSVSGVHVAIIASALLMLGRAARLSNAKATLLALAATAIYVAILGLPPPAVRAAVMFGCVLLASLRQRPASEWSILVLGALLPVLVHPAAPLDLGWQLSVLGVVSLAASGRLARRLRWYGGGMAFKLRREMLASTVASAGSTPLIAWYFGTVSLTAAAANLLAAPIVTVLQPALFLALVCAPVLPVARFVAGAAHPALAALDAIAAGAAAPTWAALELAPTLAESLLAGALMFALLAAMVQRDATLPLIGAVCAGALLVGFDLLPSRGSGLLELHQLDVGQGDAAAIRTPRGRWVIVDAGGGAPGIDRGRRTLLPYIRSRGGDVEGFILSHPHLDHVGGAPAIIGALRPARYLDGAFAGSTPAYRASLDSAAVHGVQWQRVRPGDSLLVDGVTFRFLAPDSAWTAGLQDANLASTIVRVEYGQVALLLTGDAELEEEEWVLRHTPAEWLRADVLKVGHHGSRTSSGPAFLDAVQPRVALVSVGRGNSYGHPSPDVIAAFERRGSLVLRTDVVGTTVVRSDGTSITVTTAAQHWSLPSRLFAAGFTAH